MKSNTLTNQEFFSLGLMSGSSLDGLDICYSKISVKDESYRFEILQAETIPYEADILMKLKNCREFDQNLLNSFDIQLGSIYGDLCTNFIEKYAISNLDFISSHGHTVFHFPERGFTVQIGSGQEIANKTKIKTICNLRQKDIDLGGSGAPIVPIGDLLFFRKYKYCLNLGGIMNVSVKDNNSIFSFDIGSCNQILNYYSSKLGYEYDHGGNLARSGNLHSSLFEKLKENSYYSLPYPKSLDNSFSDKIISIIDRFEISDIHDILNTYTEHIAWLLAENIDSNAKCLITGGGSHNDFLIEILKTKYSLQIEIPSKELIDFKEALVMSLIGVRYFENKFNVLASVTGAKENTRTGDIYFPINN